MMAASVRTLMVDVPPDLVDATVAFWCSALEAEPDRPDDLDAHPYVPLVGARSALRVTVQQAYVHPRYHLDLATADVDAETHRFEAAGATRRERGHLGDRAWWVMTDPAGNWLCTVPERDPGTVLAPRRGDRSYLDGVFVDVPAADVDACVAFWSAALGATPEPGDPYTVLPGLHGPGGELTFAVQRVDAPARLHVDVTTDEVEPEVERLVSLGARRVHQVEDWWTLADPAGNLFCVVPS